MKIGQRLSTQNAYEKGSGARARGCLPADPSPAAVSSSGFEFWSGGGHPAAGGKTIRPIQSCTNLVEDFEQEFSSNVCLLVGGTSRVDPLFSGYPLFFGGVSSPCLDLHCSMQSESTLVALEMLGSAGAVVVLRECVRLPRTFSRQVLCCFFYPKPVPTATLPVPFHTKTKTITFPVAATNPNRRCPPTTKTQGQTSPPPLPHPLHPSPLLLTSHHRHHHLHLLLQQQQPFLKLLVRVHLNVP